MKILIAHNRYQQAGGEDAVVKTEFDILKKFGEDVRLYERSNEELNSCSPLKKMNFLCNMGYSKTSYEDFRAVLKEFSPDVVHFHNIFFAMTPSVYEACRQEAVAVVQSLHNFRLLCSNALFFREGKVCEECFEHKNLWRGVWHGCYRNSRLSTAFVVRMLEDHWKKGTWLSHIDRYITATEFSRKKYITAGIPAERISVKPHVNPTEADRAQQNKDGGYALYAGRLTHEKGLEVLLRAWKQKSFLPLKILGDGPLAPELRKKAQDMKDIEFVGFVSEKRYDEYLQEAKFLVVPSLCYENFPRVVAEAYSFGIPVLASRLGGFLEIVLNEETGLLFRPDSEDDLLQKIEWLMSHQEKRSFMQKKIAELYKILYSPYKNYQMLIDIYKKAIFHHNSLLASLR